MSKGNPKLDVRASADAQAEWKAAAARAGLDFSAWVRLALDAALDAALAQLDSSALTPEARRQLEEVMAAHRPDDCPHPGYKPGASGLLVCKRCGQPKPRTT